MAAENHGRWYWCVLVTKDVEPKQEVLLHAEGIELREGSLVMMGTQGIPVLILAAGKWLGVYAASCLDGHPVAVCHGLGTDAAGEGE